MVVKGAPARPILGFQSIFQRGRAINSASKLPILIGAISMPLLLPTCKKSSTSTKAKTKTVIAATAKTATKSPSPKSSNLAFPKHDRLLGLFALQPSPQRCRVSYARLRWSEDVYMGMLAKLDEALALIDETDANFKGDVIYNGDMTKWEEICQLAQNARCPPYV